MVLTFLLTNASAQAQKSVVQEWDSTKFTQYQYIPEPLILVHGYNANDGSWSNKATGYLATRFSSYYINPSAAQNLVNAAGNANEYRCPQVNYVHTFNYGDKPNQKTHESNSYDHAEWNTMEDDRASTTPIYNPYRMQPGYTDPDTKHMGWWDDPPRDGRATVDKRIKDILDAYTPRDWRKINNPNDSLNINFVGHSAGGALVGHYYMTRKANDNSRVRRFVTLGSPHRGSRWATVFSPNTTACEGKEQVA